MSAVVAAPTVRDAVEQRDVPALTSALRTILRPENVPNELRALKGWVVWCVTQIDAKTGKFNKIPHYPGGEVRSGEQGSEKDRAQLGTFEEAMAAFERNPDVAGIGLAMLPNWNATAFDADHCVGEDGVVRGDVLEQTQFTYAEYSPSGTGVRAFWRGTAANGRNSERGYELYSQKQFVTVTGNTVDNMYQLLGGALPALDDELRARLESLCSSKSKVNSTTTTDAPGKSAQLAIVAANDPTLARLNELGMVERDMGGGKYSIQCPFEDGHSDPDRAPGDGDTVYYLAHTNGYDKPHVHCMHAGCAEHTDEDFREALGIDPLKERLEQMRAEFNDVSGEGWPTPHPIPHDLPPVPKFELKLLPNALRSWIADIAERMQIDADIPACAAVAALSSAVGRRVRIRPKAYDDWEVVPNLWAMVVAPPGYMKSPALSEVTKPLHRLEGEVHAEYQAAYALWAEQVESLAIAKSAAKAVAVAQLRKDATATINAPPPDPDPPVAIRYTVNNFSLEALGEVLIGNPDGVLAFADELHGLLASTGKQGNEGLHDFLLSAWTGDNPYAFDRIGRGLNRRIDHCCVSILGGIQPGRLTEYVLGATQGGAGDSGLVQRFQLLTWPDLREEWTLIDRKPDRDAQEAAYRVFERVVGRGSFDDPTSATGDDVRRFAPDAQAAFYEWLEKLEHEVRGKTLPPVMASHLSKYRSLVPSLALIFAVADGIPGDVPLRYVEQAIGWAAYLRPHAERVYACATNPNTRHARALLIKITEGAVADEFKPADIYWKGWTLLSDPASVERATTLLTDLGYLLRVETRPKSGGGRPSVTYVVNPKSKA